MNSPYIFCRIFWTTIVLSLTICIIYSTSYIMEGFKNEAVFVSWSPASPSVDAIDFPGIAICNLNILSKSRIETFVDQIGKTRSLKQNGKTNLLTWLKMLGNQYTFSTSGSRYFNPLQNALKNYFGENYDITALLKNLTVPCRELIADCEWNREKFDCRELFQSRLTDSGFCCVFNNVRPTFKPYLYTHMNESTPTLVKKIHGAGESYGLSVFVHNNESDYFYTILESRGVLIKIFSPYDYPDQISGNLGQVLVTPDVKALVAIDTNTLKTWEPNVKRLPPKYRKCQYRYEGDSLMSGRYSQSDCNVACRTESILSMCDCIPFMEPIDKLITSRYNVVTTCDMIDIPCLSRYQGKWSRYYYVEMEDIPTLRMEVQDSLHCDYCLPNCKDITYKIETSFFQYRNRSTKNKGISQVLVYLKRADTNLFTKTVTVTWYEAISILGGLFSLFLGISLLNIIEMLVLLVNLLFESIVLYYSPQ